MLIAIFARPVKCPWIMERSKITYLVARWGTVMMCSLQEDASMIRSCTWILFLCSGKDSYLKFQYDKLIVIMHEISVCQNILKTIEDEMDHQDVVNVREIHIKV